MSKYAVILNDARPPTAEARAMLREEMIATLKLKPEHVDRIFKRLPVVLKKGIDLAVAERYLLVVERMGADAVIRHEDSYLEEQQSTPQSSFHAQENEAVAAESTCCIDESLADLEAMLERELHGTFESLDAEQQQSPFIENRKQDGAPDTALGFELLEPGPGAAVVEEPSFAVEQDSDEDESYDLSPKPEVEVSGINELQSFGFSLEDDEKEKPTRRSFIPEAEDSAEEEAAPPAAARPPQEEPAPPLDEAPPEPPAEAPRNAFASRPAPPPTPNEGADAEHNEDTAPFRSPFASPNSVAPPPAEPSEHLPLPRARDTRRLTVYALAAVTVLLLSLGFYWAAPPAEDSSASLEFTPEFVQKHLLRQKFILASNKHPNAGAHQQAWLAEGREGIVSYKLFVLTESAKPVVAQLYLTAEEPPTLTEDELVMGVRRPWLREFLAEGLSPTTQAGAAQDPTELTGVGKAYLVDIDTNARIVPKVQITVNGGAADSFLTGTWSISLGNVSPEAKYFIEKTAQKQYSISLQGTFSAVRQPTLQTKTQQ